MIVNFDDCISCNTSYNVLRHSHIYRGAGGLKKRGSPDSSSPEVGISDVFAGVFGPWTLPRPQFMLGLHFTPACVLLWVCGLHFTHSLHLTPGKTFFSPQSSARSPQSGRPQSLFYTEWNLKCRHNNLSATGIEEKSEVNALVE